MDTRIKTLTTTGVLTKNIVSTGRLKKRPMLRHIQEKSLRQTLHVRVASKTQTI